MNISEDAQEGLEELWVQTADRGKKSGGMGEAGTEAVISELLRTQNIVRTGDEFSLTARGYEAAKGIIRRHRLAERLLYDVLDMGVGEIEASACEFEHILSEGVEESICILLGHPRECPHGRSIPPGKCCKQKKEMAGSVISPLSSLKKGRRGKIAYIYTKNHDNLPKLLAMGILPGMNIEVIQTYPTYVFQVGETQVAVDAEIANDILVRPM